MLDSRKKRRKMAVENIWPTKPQTVSFTDKVC